jgi:hypothetical protein
VDREDEEKSAAVEAHSWKTNGIFEDSEDSEDEEKPAAVEAQSPCGEDDRKPPAVESLQTNGISNDSEDEQKPAAEEVELPFTQSKPNDLSVPNAWKTNGIYNPWLQWGMNIHRLRVTNTCALDCTLYLLGFLTLNKCIAKQIVTVEPLTTALQYLKDQETKKEENTENDLLVN